MSPVIGFAENLRDHPGPETLDRGLFQYAWLEGTMKVRFDFLDQIKAWNDLNTWPKGRLFGDQGEYRWQQTGQGFHVVLILEDDSLPQPFSHILTLKRDGEDAPLILWGDWINPEGENEPKTNPQGGPRFWAREIPPILDYPLDKEQLRTITDAVKKQQSQPGRRIYLPTPRLVVRSYRHDPIEKNEPFQGKFLRCVRLTVLSEKEDNERYKNDQD